MRQTKKIDPQALLAWVLPVLMFALILAVFGIRYDTNDDAIIANLAAGAYGPDRLHLVYINVIFGALLRPLYWLAPGANWYVIVSLAAMLLSCVVLCRLAMERFGTLPGLLLFAVLGLAFAPDMLYRFQYVRTTAVCLAAGLALLAARLGQGARRVWPALALITLGSLLRWEMFCAAGGLSAALLLGKFFALDRAGRRRAVATMAAMFTLVLAAKAVDVAAYQLDDGWRAFSAYNDVRTEFSDFKVQFFTNGVNPFAQVGISDTDYAMLLNWDYYDDTVFPPQRIAELNAMIPTRDALHAAWDTLLVARTLLTGSGAHWAFSLILLVGLALLLRPGRHCLPYWGTLFLLGAELWYLMWRARWGRYIEASLLLLLAVFALAALPRRQLQRRGKAAAAAALALLAVLCLPALPALKEESDYFRATRSRAGARFDAFSADKAHTYLVPVDAINDFCGYDVWRPRGENYFSNLFLLGGWLSHAPHQEQLLKSAGLVSPLVDAVDREDIYVVSPAAGAWTLVDYVSQHIGQPVTAQPVPERPDELCRLVRAEG